MGGTGPLGKGGRVVPKGSVVDLIDEDAEEGGGLVTRVRLELRLNIEDECGGDSGEQTSLLSLSVCIYQGLMRITHEDKSGIEILVILLHELLVVFLSLLAVVLKEPGPMTPLGGRQVYWSLAARVLANF